MKQRTKDRAVKWLETAKSKDTFSIDTVPYSKKEIEDLVGGIEPVKHTEQINIDIEEPSYGDLGEEHYEDDTEESGE